MLKNNLFQDKRLITLISDRKDGNIDLRFGIKGEAMNNRKKLVKFLGCHETDLYEMEQVHGSQVKIIGKKIKKNIFPQTDTLITNLKNVFLMVKTADCFPILFFDPDKKVTAVCHAGWRGATEKIFLKTLWLMLSHFHCPVGKIKIVIGPGARKCCFKHHHFLQEKLPEWKKFIRACQKSPIISDMNDRQKKPSPERNAGLFGRRGFIKKVKDDKALDIPAFITEELMAVGVKRKNIHDLKICTVCNKNYFSHFRSLRKNENEGRFATIIGLR